MKIKINTREIYQLILLLIMVPTFGLTQINGLENIIKWLSFAASLGYVLICKKKKEEFHMESLFFCVFLLIQTFWVFQSNEAIMYWIRFLVTLVSIYFYICNTIAENQNRTINLIIAYGVINIIIEGFLFIFGITEYYSYTFLLYPLVAFGYIYLINIEKQKKYKVSFYMVSILGIVPVYIVQGFKDIEVSYVLEVIIFVIILWFPKFLRKFSPLIAFGILLVLNQGLILSDFLLKNEFFRYIVVEIFKKNLTFSGRTNLWKKSLDIVLENPLRGCGVGWKGIITSKGFMNSHNQFLNIAVMCGLIGLAVFIIGLIATIIRMNKNENSKYLIWMLFPELVMFMGLAYGYVQLLPFFMLFILIKRVAICSQIQSYKKKI